MPDDNQRIARIILVKTSAAVMPDKLIRSLLFEWSDNFYSGMAKKYFLLPIVTVSASGKLFKNLKSILEILCSQLKVLILALREGLRYVRLIFNCVVFQNFKGSATHIRAAVGVTAR